jgi:hypothetical protein
VVWPLIIPAVPVQVGNTPAVEALSRFAGVRLVAKDKDGRTPFQLAKAGNWPEVQALMVRHSYYTNLTRIGTTMQTRTGTTGGRNSPIWEW